MLVFWGHSVHYALSDCTGLFWRPITMTGSLGVDIFFVISGYLITTLLVREWNSSARIDLAKFYVRRAFRIIPACYFYVAVAFALMAARLIPRTFSVSLLSPIFLRNYAVALGLGNIDDWFTGHYWTLAVEEQFYLFWPACVAVLGPRRATWLATGLIVASPVMRVLTYFALPDLRPAIGVMGHTRIDTIMVGSLAALLADSSTLRAAVRRATDARLHLVAIFWVSVIAPPLAGRFLGVYLFLVGYTMEAACITLVMLWLIERPDSFAGKVLNHRAVVHIGVVSYSFYLWQQLFTPLGLPWSIAPTMLMAEASYRLIERPFLRLRDRVLLGWHGPARPLRETTGLPHLEEYRDGIISA